MLGYSNTGKGKTLLLFFPEAIAFDVIAALVLDVRVPTLRGKFTRMKKIHRIHLDTIPFYGRGPRLILR